MAYDNIYDEKPANTLVDAGTYECVLSAEERKNKFTNEVELNLCFKIRKGIGQKNEGRLVFMTVKHDKNSKEDYNHSVIAAILKTVPEKRTFADNDELIQFLNGLYILTPVVIEEANEYHQTDKNKVKIFDLDSSKVPPTDEEKRENMGNTIKSTNSLPEISTDDLPF